MTSIAYVRMRALVEADLAVEGGACRGPSRSGSRGSRWRRSSVAW
jgi:hypothetical protein